MSIGGTSFASCLGVRIFKMGVAIMTAKTLKEDIEDLKESTVKLGKQLSEATADHIPDSKTISRIPRDILTQFNRYLKVMTQKASGIADDATRGSKRVHETIKDKPYWFLVGALGIGVLIGKLWNRGREREK